MPFEPKKKNIALIKHAIEEGDDKFIINRFENLHPADVVEFVDKLNFDDAKYVIRLLDNEFAAAVLIELDEDVRDRLIGDLTSKEIAEMVIEHVDSDDAADVLADLPNKKKEEVISLLEDVEQASDIIDLLGYEEDTAGGLMATELIQVQESWTIPKAVREMRKQAEELDEVYTIYVVNEKEQLLGTLSLKKLLFTSSLHNLITDIYNQDELKFAYTSQSSEEVAQIMQKYDMVVLPVVDENMTLLGRITIDDVVDVIREEAEKDYQMASGISEQIEEHDRVWVMTRARLPWLLIGLVGGVLVSQVIGVYEGQLHLYPELAFFIPLIAAMGGNVGVQSSAIVVQGLANNSLDLSDLSSKLTKELSVSLINATVCSFLLFLYNFFFAQSVELAYTVSISLFTVIIVASLFGTLIPLMLDKFKIDPALATGPFITTTNDIIGLFIYFIVANMMYGI